MEWPLKIIIQGAKALKEKIRPGKFTKDRVNHPRPDLFLFIFLSWLIALAWFHPRLSQLFNIAQGGFQTVSIGFFIVFVELAWLYGFYNIGVILFAMIYRWSHPIHKSDEDTQCNPILTQPAVALLYTTCNDFVEESARSCVLQNYPDYTVYILDDSADPTYRKRIDRFAASYPGRVRVVRRPDQKGFKAGNLNHALGGAASVNRSLPSPMPTKFCRKIS